MEINKSLEKLGLTQNEITVYLYLLSNGESQGNQLYKSNLLDKSATYKAIAQLLSRSLIITSGDSRNQIYKIAPKEQVLSLFEQEKKAIEESQSLFSKAFTDLEKYSAEHYQSENVQVFTGENAFESYHKEILRGDIEVFKTLTTSETEHTLAGGKHIVDKTNNWFIKARVSKGIAVHVLYDLVAIPDEYDISDSSKLKECRRYPCKMSLPAKLMIFGERVGFSTIKNGKFWALIINDKLIATMLTSVYDSMWSQSKKV
jgi:sugar-specific transcriptional regulator TrmB